MIISDRLTSLKWMYFCSSYILLILSLLFLRIFNDSFEKYYYSVNNLENILKSAFFMLLYFSPVSFSEKPKLHSAAIKKMR